MGMPCDLTIFRNFEKYNLPLIEDAACAIGSEYNFNNKWEKIGKYMVQSLFFISSRKIITTGDSGIITTNSKKYAHELKLLRQHFMNI